MRRRRSRRPSVRVGTAELDRMCPFFDDIGWNVDRSPADFAVVDSPGGRFALFAQTAPPRLELALSVPDPLDVELLLEAVEGAGGLVMEPLQETVWGGWGFSFNDPEGNNWEVGSPRSVTAIDRQLSTGVRMDGPIVALAVPRASSHP